MGFDDIVERRITEGREAGLFDNLPGEGRPIPDIGRQRPEGWWADRLVTNVRARTKRDELTADVRRARPGLWRAETESELRSMVTQLNDRIAEHNYLTDTSDLAPFPRLDVEETVAIWFTMQAGRR